MHKNLVIVESPAKAKTIEKFLGSDYKVLSSYGHIRDLKKKDLSIEVDKNFTPIYEVPADKKKLVAELKKEAKAVDIVWLASDEDREGEAISWHLYEVLGLSADRTRRIVFHEITKDAILKAIETPRAIDQNLVNAQQARRVLDRLVGFELSPILWKKVKPALSAGRVQSVAVRLVVEREREVIQYQPTTYYRVLLQFEIADPQGGHTLMRAELSERLSSKQEALDLIERCQNSTFTIESISKRPIKKSPAAPFTTSTLQQEAARKLGFSVKQTMSVAQKLYESGYITYMRTDSVNLSSLAINAAKQEIISWLGEEYWQVRQYHTKAKGAQEAHEAIRPTYISHHKIKGTATEQRLYELIWKRTIASQMSEAQLEKTTVSISMSNGAERFVAEGEVIVFDGFLKAYLESADDDAEIDTDTDKLLPPLVEKQSLSLSEAVATQRYTQRPARYTEASLVKKLEELGIGRPSTYAPTITTLQDREYVIKSEKEGQERVYNMISLVGGRVVDEDKTEIFGTEKAKLFPTDTGIVVNDFLIDAFPEVLNYNFTATVENQFDEIAEGNEIWTNVLSDFYAKFHPVVEAVSAFKSERKTGEKLLGSDPKTGRPVSVKIGRYGPIVQIGQAEDTEKPLFAPLKIGQSMETITLEQALDLFGLPRNVGEFEDKVVTIGIGRFGPYIRHDAKFISLPKGVDPMEISLEESVLLIEAKRVEERNKILKVFDAEPGLEIVNGRYGPYIAYNKKNYKIPKGEVPDQIELARCMELIADADAKEASGEKPAYRKRTAKAKR